MFKKLNKKGFTLAELLVVVAIIGVLVAISIPIFTSQLEKSREAVDLANLRAAYAAGSAAALTQTTAEDFTKEYHADGVLGDGGTGSIAPKATVDGFQSGAVTPPGSTYNGKATGTKIEVTYSAANGTIKVDFK